MIFYFYFKCMYKLDHSARLHLHSAMLQNKICTHAEHICAQSQIQVMNKQVYQYKKNRIAMFYIPGNVLFLRVHVLITIQTSVLSVVKFETRIYNCYRNNIFVISNVRPAFSTVYSSQVLRAVLPKYVDMQCRVVIWLTATVPGQYWDCWCPAIVAATTLSDMTLTVRCNSFIVNLQFSIHTQLSMIVSRKDWH